MEIGAMLDELREMALTDEKIRQELLDTRKDAHPLAAFAVNAGNWDMKFMKWI